jgi:hypothetical protein
MRKREEFYMSQTTTLQPKRFLLWAVACALLVSLVACGSATGADTAQPEEQPAATDQTTEVATEANDADENLFGMERTLEALNKAKDGTAYDEIQSVQDAVGRFVGDAPQFDDLTMLCLQYNGVDEEANAKGGLAC